MKKRDEIKSKEGRKEGYCESQRKEEGPKKEASSNNGGIKEESKEGKGK